MKTRMQVTKNRCTIPIVRTGLPKSDTPVLDNFGIDITKAAEEGTLDPIVGETGKSNDWPKF